MQNICIREFNREGSAIAYEIGRRKVLVHCSLLWKISASASAIIVVSASLSSHLFCLLPGSIGLSVRPFCRLLHRALKTAIRSMALPGTLPITVTPPLQWFLYLFLKALHYVDAAPKYARPLVTSSASPHARINRSSIRVFKARLCSNMIHRVSRGHQYSICQR